MKSWVSGWRWFGFMILGVKDFSKIKTFASLICSSKFQLSILSREKIILKSYLMFPCKWSDEASLSNLCHPERDAWIRRASAWFLDYPLHYTRVSQPLLFLLLFLLVLIVLLMYISCLNSHLKHQYFVFLSVSILLFLFFITFLSYHLFTRSLTINLKL